MNDNTKRALRELEGESYLRKTIGNIRNRNRGNLWKYLLVAFIAILVYEYVQAPTEETYTKRQVNAIIENEIATLREETYTKREVAELITSMRNTDSSTTNNSRGEIVFNNDAYAEASAMREMQEDINDLKQQEQQREWDEQVNQHRDRLANEARERNNPTW